MTKIQREWATALAQEMMMRYFLIAVKGCHLENSEALDIPESEIIHTLKFSQIDKNELFYFVDNYINIADWTNSLSDAAPLGERERRYIIDNLKEVW